MIAPETAPAPATGKPDKASPLAFLFDPLLGELQHLDRALSAMGVAVDAARPILSEADAPCLADALLACLRACNNELGGLEDRFKMMSGFGAGSLSTPAAAPTT